ncbi:hypothetical protein H6F88_26060 [Oculatella sp. FACHB-28]|uniref:hypothetical protein n=1 Tax=Oculatella sp. FACHB-28 TaxID=2692845 RepID=UPI00168A39C7|nr:hypothetical protein [Oculatella sp. FACHB-28]MBD2059420.1 hypothetical protein [Oculatella sp. FACHB-28]
MNRTIDMRQLELVLVVEKHNPILLNPEFLKTKGIIPFHWELTQPPTYDEGVALTIFQNGVYIAHRGNAIAFFEDVREKNLDELEVPDVVYRYVERLPQENYQAVGLNLEGHTLFDDQDTARSYLQGTLLNGDRPHTSDQNLVQMISNFIYKLDEGVFTLTVRNTELELSKTEHIPVLLFAANFHRDLSKILEAERVQTLSQIIENWEDDVDTYQDIVNNQFLAQSNRLTVSAYG